EPFQVVGWQRLLEPDDVVVGEHLRRLQGPLVTVWPELLAAAGVHHQFDAGADGVAGGADQLFVRLAVAPAERAPAELDGLETAGDGLAQRLAQWFRLVEENGAVGLDAVAVAAAEQAVDRLVADLSHEVPQGDVDAADGVFDGAAAALPER